MNAKYLDTDRELVEEFSEVESSNLAAAGTVGEDLIVWFKAGPAYRYPGARDLFHALVASESKGRFFHAKVRPRYAIRLCGVAGCSEASTSDVLGGPLRFCSDHASRASR